MCTEDIRTGSEPGRKERCSAESSERSSLATTPEPRRDRLGSLPTPRPRFPPPNIPHDRAPPCRRSNPLAESVTSFVDRWLGDQGRRGRLTDATNCLGLSDGDPVRLPDLENGPSCAKRTAE